MKRGFDWSGIHRDVEGGFFRSFLKGLSVLYGVGVRTRLWGYRRGLIKQHTLPVFVVSIGNITSGGTGKTPAVKMLASWALEQGYRPAVLSRGYRGNSRDRVLLVSDGKEIKCSQEMSGDEPYLLAQSLPEVPVVVTKKRYNGGTLVIEELCSDFLILDDGFQHLELQRNLNILLLDASNPFGNSRLLPRGPLREPIRQLERADCCILTHSRECVEAPAFGRLKTARLRNIPIFKSDHLPVEAVFPESGERLQAGMLEGKRVVAFAGIAHPGYFKKTLESLGAEIVYFEAFGDHHRYRDQEIRALVRKKETLNAHYALTTAKDWVKIDAAGPGEKTLGYLEIVFTFLERGEAFYKLVRERFDDFSKTIRSEMKGGHG